MTPMVRGSRVPMPADRPEPLPNLVIAGVAKAGTTSLFRYLAQHPEVCPSSVKEARYFTALRYGEPLAPVADYARLFASCRGETYRMEATPGYFPGGRVVAQAIDELLPGSRVVVSLRDPVQRCWSWYRFVKSTARIPEQMGFPAYLDRCAELHRAGVDHLRAHQPFWVSAEAATTAGSTTGSRSSASGCASNSSRTSWRSHRWSPRSSAHGWDWAPTPAPASPTTSRTGPCTIGIAGCNGWR